MNFRRAALPVLALLAIAAAGPVSADLPASPDYAPAATSFAPQVPVSAFARPSGWLDMSRLNVSTSVSFGTFGGTSTGLQVTSLSYQLARPLAVRVSVGNTFGSGNLRGGTGRTDPPQQPLGQYAHHGGRHQKGFDIHIE